MAQRSVIILRYYDGENQVLIPGSSSVLFSQAKVGKRQARKANQVHHGKDNGAARGVSQDKLGEQQANGAGGNQDKTAQFNKPLQCHRCECLFGHEKAP